MADYQISASQSRVLALSSFMRGVYGWMSLGLGLTALVAFMMVSSRGAMEFVFGNTMVFFGLIIAELALVMILSAAIGKLSGATAGLLFLGYSALNGVTISAVLLLYTGASVAGTFVVCAGMFGAMSLYGLTTGKDLTSFGSFLFMGLIGIVLASLVNMFLRSPGLDFAISGIGVLVFVGLTAYDTQKLKEMGLSAPTDDALAVRRGTILGALTLYLDFINLFLMLLRLFGSRRD